MTNKERMEAEEFGRLIGKVARLQADARNAEKGWFYADYCLPDNEESVFVCVSRTVDGALIGQSLGFASLCNGVWVNDEYREIENTYSKVTHWMPLDNLMPEV